MENKELYQIVQELSRMNQKFDKMIDMMISARKRLEEDKAPKIGSSGEIDNKQSEK